MGDFRTIDMFGRAHLKPFFSYFGSKWRDASNYPKPRSTRIIEPFAGSAGYSMHYPDLDVTLYDLDPVIVGVWDFLIKAKRREILSMPDVGDGQCVESLPIPQEQRWLIGFWLTRAGERPRKHASAWMRSGERPGAFWGPQARERIAHQVQAIRHWRVVEGDYSTAPDVEATWFIDAPYQVAGHRYVKSARLIDFGALAIWCKSRSGQVIVCENEGAQWLDFNPLAMTKTMRGNKMSREAVWLNVDDAESFDFVPTPWDETDENRLRLWFCKNSQATDDQRWANNLALPWRDSGGWWRCYGTGLEYESLDEYAGR